MKQGTKERAYAIGAFAFALTGLMVLAAGACMVVLNAFLIRFRPGTELWLGLHITNIFGVMLSIYGMTHFLYLYEKAAQVTEDSGARSQLPHGNYLVYLRPFAIERRLNDFRGYSQGLIKSPFVALLAPVRVRYSLQRQVKKAAAQCGVAVVAIGGHDRMPGVTKLLVENINWQGSFIELVQRGKGAVIIPFTTKGTMWELEWLLRHAWWKTLLIMPPDNAEVGIGARNLSYRDRWNCVRDDLAEFIRLPEYQKEGGVYYFWQDGGNIICDGGDWGWSESSLASHVSTILEGSR